MISKEEHARIAAHMPGKVYQTFDRLRKRLSFAEKFFDCFAGLTVVEFGCNAGYYARSILAHAKYYIGIDQSPRYMSQARVQHSLLPLEMQERCEFVERRLKGWLRDREKAAERGEVVQQVDAAFMSFALYHFTDKEIALLEKFLPTLDVVIVQTRTKKRKPWRDHNSHRFWDVRNVERWLEGLGFVVNSDAPNNSFADTIARTQEYIDRHVPASLLDAEQAADSYQDGTRSGLYCEDEPLEGRVPDGEVENVADAKTSTSGIKGKSATLTIVDEVGGPADPRDSEAAREGLDAVMDSDKAVEALDAMEELEEAEALDADEESNTDADTSESDRDSAGEGAAPE